MQRESVPNAVQGWSNWWNWSNWLPDVAGVRRFCTDKLLPPVHLASWGMACAQAKAVQGQQSTSGVHRIMGGCSQLGQLGQLGPTDWDPINVIQLRVNEYETFEIAHIIIWYNHLYIYIYPERQMPSLTWYWCDAKFYLVELRMSGKLIWGCQICPPEPIWAQETPHGWREPLPTALPLAHAGNRGSPFFPLVASSFLWGLKRYRDDESGTLPPLLARVSTGMGQRMVINNIS